MSPFDLVLLLQVQLGHLDLLEQLALLAQPGQVDRLVQQVGPF